MKGRFKHLLPFYHPETDEEVMIEVTGKLVQTYENCTYERYLLLDKINTPDWITEAMIYNKLNGLDLNND